MKTKTPTLIIDKQKVKENIVSMYRKAKDSDAIFRSHFKTHQSAELGGLLKVGDTVGVLPIHSCLTAGLLRDSTLL